MHHQLKNVIVVSLLVTFVLLSDLVAQEPSTQTVSAEDYGSVPLVVPEKAKAGPSFDVSVATQAWIDTLSPEQRERSDAYFEGGYWLQLWGLLYGLLVAWIFLRFRISARMRDWSEKLTGLSGLHTFTFAVMYFVAVFILGLPFSIYSGFMRERKYDLLSQDFGPWFWEQLIALGFSLLLGGIGLVVFYWVLKKTGRTWWVWGTLVATVHISIIRLIAPVFIAPAFNDYQPLEASPVREVILSLARASGVPGDDVYWFDASRQTKRISANVSGFGPTIRISLNDNLLLRSPRESIEAVMAHEIGHYVLNHIYEGIVYYSLVLLGGFLFVDWGFRHALSKWGAKWNVRGLSDTAGLPLLIAVMSVYMFLMTPVLNTIVRANEAEADIFGLQAAGQPDGFAQAAMQLSEYRKISPNKWEEILFYDHPSGYQRVKMAMEYKAEQVHRANR